MGGNTAFGGQLWFLGEDQRLFKGRQGWGVSPKPQLALGWCENKGEAQSPLALGVEPPLPSLRGRVRVNAPGWERDRGLGAAEVPSPGLWGVLWGVAPRCLRSWLWERGWD